MARPVIVRVAARPVSTGGIVAYWLGENASIPSPWQVAASLCDGRFAMGLQTVLGAQGGSEGAHDHGETEHSHARMDSPTAGIGGGMAPGGVAAQEWLDHREHHEIGDANLALTAVDASPGHVEAVPVALDVSAAFASWDMSTFKAEALFPHKTLFLWHSEADPPSGFYRCQGQTVNGVTLPDTAGKFLLGVQDYEGWYYPGYTGGDAAHDHTVRHYHWVPESQSQTFVRGYSTVLPNHYEAPHGHWLGWDYNLGYETLTTLEVDHMPPYTETGIVAFLGWGDGEVEGPGAVYGIGDVPDELLPPRGIVLPCLGYELGEDEYGYEIVIPPSTWAFCDGGAWEHGAPDGYGEVRPDLQSPVLMVRHVSSPGADGGAVHANANWPRHTHGVVHHVHTVSVSSASTFYVGDGDDQFFTATPSLMPDDHGGASTTTQVSSVQNVYTYPPYLEVLWIVKD
jgi:hypothetical protein